MRGRPTLLLAMLAALALFGAAPAPAAPPAPAPAAGSVLWLCHPSIADDPCEIPLDVTYQRRDQAPRVSEVSRPPERRRPVDCFYVYPTVSNDLTTYAAMRRAPEVRDIARWQAAWFSPQCRMFAPVYRQSTLVNLLGGMLGLPRDRGPGYADVRTAWRQYLARDNDGRGVVLIGHSQGTFMLRQLIRDEIEKRPAVRDRLVGALLLGGNVETRRGRALGGDFTRVPLCTRKGQAGCVVAYSTYGYDPKPGATFGNSRGLARGREVACTDPARLAGRAGKPVHLLQPSRPFTPGLILLGIEASYAGRPPRADTTWVSPPDRYVGSCRRINGVHVLRHRPVGPSHRIHEYPPSWGTHLVDINLELQNLTRIVRLQTRTWLRQH